VNRLLFEAATLNDTLTTADLLDVPIKAGSTTSLDLEMM
jgi:hypothetical protein